MQVVKSTSCRFTIFPVILAAKHSSGTPFEMALQFYFTFIVGVLVSWSAASRVAQTFESNKYYSAVCDEYRSCSLYEGKDATGSHAYGMFNDDVETDGWGKLWLHGDATNDGWYESGFLEGALTSQRIYQHYKSWYAHQFPSPPSEATLQFLLDQYNFAKDLAATESSDPVQSAYYTRIGQVLSQFEGVVAGMNFAAAEGESLAKIELLMLEAAGDLYDIIPATTPSEFKLKIGKLTAKEFEEEWHRVVSCSAMIKISNDLSDVFVGHTTWTSYTGMLRIFKNYNLNGGSYQVSFSAKPGSIYSKDDFYVLPQASQQLAVLETTNGILNSDLYKNVVTSTLLTWQRMPIANSLATSGPEWSKIFSTYQSGTYVNQYMVVDMKKFTPGVGAADNFLYLTEVLPGQVFVGDVTNVVKSLGNYWPSYNIPYFKDNYIIAGYQAAYETYGDAYSYDNCTRALMMRRDLPNIETFDNFLAAMRQNNYKTDEYANGDPANAISPRKDLTQNYAFGGIDTKATSYSRIVLERAAGVGQSVAQNGPTHENSDLPPFRWSTSGSTEVHLGQPDLFDFGFVEMDLYAN